MQTESSEQMSTVKTALSGQVCVCPAGGEISSLCLSRKVGCDLEGVSSDAKVVDATGKLVMPGLQADLC